MKSSARHDIANELDVDLATVPHQAVRFRSEASTTQSTAEELLNCELTPLNHALCLTTSPSTSNQIHISILSWGFWPNRYRDALADRVSSSSRTCLTRFATRYDYAQSIMTDPVSKRDLQKAQATGSS